MPKQLPKPRPSQAGFTLIELLIVVTISVMLMLTASSLFMTLMIGSTKTNSSTLIKQQGNVAMQQIDFLLRNAIDLQPNSTGQTCDPSMTEVVIRSIDGGTTRLRTQLDTSDNRYKIASISGTGTSRYLTAGSVEIVGNNLNISCTQSPDFLSRYLTVSFTLRKGTPGIDQARDIVEETFSSSVNLRSN